MLTVVESLLPETGQWIGLGAALLVTLMFAALGRVQGVSNELPGANILFGWAIVASVLTIAGVLTPWVFTPFFWLLVGCAPVVLIWSYRRGGFEWPALLPVFVLGAPLLLIMAGKAPSEVDSFTHWLPNGLYITEHDGFLRSNRPASHSAYPGFPYNVTFLFYSISKLAGQFIENSVILFNVLLLLMYAGLIGWLLRESGSNAPRMGWKMAAFALFCATVLNPVFVRRIWLTSYPDMSTSVIVAFAGIAAWLWIEAGTRGEQTERAKAVAFAVLLTLLINIKQANLVLVVALVVASGMVAMREPEFGFKLYLKRLPILIGLPLVIYFVWRYQIVTVSPLNENKMLALADWPFERIPDLLRNMGTVVYRKALYFAIALVFVIWGLRAWIGRPKSSYERLVIIVGASFVGYNLFLMLIFVAHFNGYPQSYWRFNTHIGYLITATMIFGVGLAFHRYESMLRPGLLSVVRRGAVLLLVLVPTLELALATYWRYDLEIPKPLLRQAGQELARDLPRVAVIGAIVPGDQGNFTSIFSHYIAIERDDVRTSVLTKPQHLASFIRSAGARPAFIWAYCPAGWIEAALGVAVTPGNAALLARVNGVWKVDRQWPHRTAGGLTKVYKHFDLSKCAAGN